MATPAQVSQVPDGGAALGGRALAGNASDDGDAGLWIARSAAAAATGALLFYFVGRARRVS